MRVQLTVRVEPHTADYIATLAANVTTSSGTRVSVNEVAAALLERAEAEDWQVTPAKLETSRPGHAQPPQPGRDSHTETPRK